MKYTEEDIKDFIVACDNMVSSKFILVNKRTSDVLKAIATSPAVYNVIAENMINFNFEYAYKMATSKAGEFTIADNKTIAFVFCMLRDIDNRKININELLVKHFSGDENGRSNYVVFCEKTILAFKNKVVDKVCGKPKTAKQSAVESKQFNTATNDRLEFLVKDIKAYIVGLKKLKTLVSKTEYLQVVENMLVAIRSRDVKYYQFFAEHLVVLAGKNKELNSRLSEILTLSKSM